MSLSYIRSIHYWCGKVVYFVEVNTNSNCTVYPSSNLHLNIDCITLFASRNKHFLSNQTHTKTINLKSAAEEEPSLLPWSSSGCCDWCWWAGVGGVGSPSCSWCWDCSAAKGKSDGCWECWRVVCGSCWWPGCVYHCWSRRLAAENTYCCLQEPETVKMMSGLLLLPLLGLRLNLHLSTSDQGNLSTLLTSKQ